MLAAAALCLASSSLAQASPSSSFTVGADSVGTHRVQFTLNAPWRTSTEIRFTGPGTTSLVLTDAHTGEFIATATRWAPLSGQAVGVDNLTIFSVDPTFGAWSVPPGHYRLTLICDGRCGVTFDRIPRHFGSALRVRGRAPHTDVWSSPIRTAGVPGGVVTHALPGDSHGALLASVAASARFTLVNQQDADVCLLSDEPVCRRFEDGEEQERTFSYASQLATDSTFRVTRIYPAVDGGETTAHRIVMTQALDARATVIFIGR